MLTEIYNFLMDERGMQTGEYMILGTVMAAGTIGAVKSVRDGQISKFEQMSSALDTDSSGNVGGGG
jgi:Flp pilus assembly pilin Flp